MRVLLMVSILIFSMSSCGENNQKQAQNQNEVNEISPRPELAIGEEYQKMEVERSLPEERALAANLLEKKITNDPKTLQILTGFKYEIDYVMIIDQEESDPNPDGSWMQFNDDFSYTWYKKNQLYQEGKYHYSDENGLLLMLSKNETQFPSEWKVKNSGNVTVLVGTSTFKNNNTQIHMVGK